MLAAMKQEEVAEGVLLKVAASERLLPALL
jgi:hypothetical protein